MESEDTQSEHILMIGIAGAGMKGVAWILSEQGHIIGGTDPVFDTTTPDDSFSRYTLLSQDQAIEHVASYNRVIYSDAVPQDHPILTAAHEKNIPSQSYQEALGHITENTELIAVTGTHGKSSTTAFLSHVAVESGLDPSVIVGASIPTWPGKHARLGASHIFIVEADEYREHFLHLKPRHIIITSIDFDHHDYFTSLEHVESAYQRFIDLLPSDGTLTIHADLPKAHPTLRLPQQTYLVSPEEVSAAPQPLPGMHMQQNTALAIRLLSEQFSVLPETSVQALATFPGLGRRQETVGIYKGKQIISDYGHHPTEIAATLSALHQTTPKEHIAVVFEAHTLNRLETFGEDFVTALNGSHTVIIYPPYQPSGRSEDAANTTVLVEKLKNGLTEKGIIVHVLLDASELLSAVDSLDSSISHIIGFSAGKLDSQLREIVVNATNN